MGLFMIFLGNLFYIINVLLISIEVLGLSLKNKHGIRKRLMCGIVLIAGCFSVNRNAAVRMVVLFLGVLFLLSRVLDAQFRTILRNTILVMLFLALMDELLVMTLAAVSFPEVSLYFCSSLCTFLSLFFVNKYLYRRYHSLARPMTLMQTMLIVFVLIMDLMLVIALQDAGYYQQNMQAGIEAVLPVLITFLVILIQLILLFPTIVSLNLLNEKVELSEKYLQEQGSYYRYLEKRERETRKFRHDLRNHLLMVQDFLEVGDLESLSEYVGQISERVNSFGKAVSLNNGIAEAIVNRFARETEQEGIELVVKGYFPSEYAISGFDLCTILGNLLRNATEAVRGCGGKHIRLEIRHEGPMLMLYMENDCDRQLSWKGDTMPSSKRDRRNHGFGLENVTDALRRNQGWIEMSAENGVFKTCISCMMERKESGKEGQEG